MSAVNPVEAAVHVDMGGDPSAGDAFDDLVREAGITVEPVTVEQAHLARRAYRAYGRGSGSPARLDFGDCFAYALAKATREPMLFKGDDVVHTDIEPAMLARASVGVHLIAAIEVKIRTWCLARSPWGYRAPGTFENANTPKRGSLYVDAKIHQVRFD